MVTLYLVYDIDHGYPEDPEETLVPIRVFTDKKKAERLAELSGEIGLCRSFNDRIKKAEDVIREEFNLDPYQLPSWLKVAEIEVDLSFVPDSTSKGEHK